MPNGISIIKKDFALAKSNPCGKHYEKGRTFLVSGLFFAAPSLRGANAVSDVAIYLQSSLYFCASLLDLTAAKPQ